LKDADPRRPDSCWLASRVCQRRTPDFRFRWVRQAVRLRPDPTISDAPDG